MSLDLQQRVAGATRPEWLTTLAAAQTTFLSELGAAYISTARAALK